MRFTERSMLDCPARTDLDFGATAPMVPNSRFDPNEGSRICDEYRGHRLPADEPGIDGIVPNKHHKAPCRCGSRIRAFGFPA